MFQPQPTSFASSCFASSSSVFPQVPSTRASSAAPNSNSSNPNSSHADSFLAPPSTPSSAYDLVSDAPLGFYLPPAPGVGGAGAAGIGAGSRSSRSESEPGQGPGPGAGPGVGAGPRRTLGATAPGLTCGSASSTSSLSQVTRHNRPQHQQPQLRDHAHHHSPVPKMEDQQDPHGMAAQQEAAKGYQPDLPNYLVGDKTPSDAITREYVKADQTYVEKTMALPQQYSHYRPVQGDGNCGWRAIGFSYFEKLIDAGDRVQIDNEASRLLDMNPMLGNVGGYNYYEDWADEFVDLLREISNNISNPRLAHALLHQKWNDSAATSGMIYYLRLLAATYLKANSEAYDPFIADSGGIDGYCSQSIELINHEIEHLGIVALVNVLLKPVDFVLEIAYLDRSPGSQVNTYRLPEETNNQDQAALGPIIYLLYRPDHYDILYRSPPSAAMEAPSHPVNVQVHRVDGFSDHAAITSTQSDLGSFSTVDFDTLAMIPGFGSTGMPMSPVGGAPASEPFQPTQQPQNPWAPPFDMTASSPQPTVVVPGPPPNPPLSPHAPMNPRPAPSGAGAQPGMMPGGSLSSSPECTIRFSPMQLEYDGGKGSYPEPTFQVTTNTFKNSVWNRAHFGNPDFHPEEWSPEDEVADGRLGSKRKGSKREP